MNLKWCCDYLPPINLWSLPNQPNMLHPNIQHHSSKLTFKCGDTEYLRLYKQRQLNY